MTPQEHLRRRVDHTDRGATLVLVALLITALAIMVALVIDFGFVRQSRQTGKTTTDAAVSAGIASLAPDATPRPWRGVCEALRYMQANEPGRTFTLTYMDGNGSTVAGSPCSSLANQECTPNTPSTWAWIRAVDGNRVVDLRSGYTLPDPNFPEDATRYSGDNGEAARGSCDHLAVIVSDRDPSYFGGIVGAVDYSTAIRTVGRVKITTIQRAVPAFLMLERTECEVLSQQVGSSEGGIIVERSTANTPGLIHVDSAGIPCRGASGNSPGAFVVYSSVLGTGPAPRPGLRLDGITPTTKGILSMYALNAGNTTNAWATPAGVSADVVGRDVISRVPVDEKYNPPSNPTITNLHAATVGLANATTTPAGYVQVATGGQCNNLDGPIGTNLQPSIFLNCPGGLSAGANLSFPFATNIVVNGPVTVANNRSLYIPLATQIVIGGDASAGLSVAGGGRLGIGGSMPAAGASNAEIKAACGVATNPSPRATRLAVYGGGSSSSQGAINISGSAAICHTTAYMAGPKTVATYQPRSTIGAGHATCVSATPCPNTSAGNPITNAQLVVTGVVRWTAPNQYATSQPPPGSQGTEDLAIWTETAQDTEIKTGGAVLDAQGVYFFPNAYVQMQAPSDFEPRDAQFIARRLKLLQGTLQMRPTPNNSVDIPILDSAGLVR